MAAVFGVVFGVVLVTRQTVIAAGSAAMTTRDGVTVVQTAPFTRPEAISSELPDAQWSSLTQLSVSSPDDSWVRLNVLGTARLQGTGVYGSVIKARAAAAGSFVTTRCCCGRDQWSCPCAAPCVPAREIRPPCARLLARLASQLRSLQRDGRVSVRHAQPA
jgi:hypothetical protein